METFVHDLRFAFRLMSKSPVFTTVAILTLALGIGANTAIFSMINAVMLRSLPVRDSQELVLLRWNAHRAPKWHNLRSYGNCANKGSKLDPNGCSFSLPFYNVMRSQEQLFSGVVAFAPQGRIDVSGTGPAAVVSGELVSGSYFQTLGIQPALGRTIEPADDSPSANPVVVLNYGYWQRAFGGDPSAVGKNIKLNGVSSRIVGVTEPRFMSLVVGNVFDVFVPLSSRKSLSPRWDPKSEDENSWWLTVVARLKPGVSRKQAEAAASLLFRNAMLDGSKFALEPNDNPTLALIPAQEGLTGLKTSIAAPLYVLSLAVGMILLIACANVAGLLLSRATARQKEMAIRLALGAGRGRILRQLLTESVVLASLGGAFGILLGSWSVQGLVSVISSATARPIGVTANVDMRVLLFTLAVSVFTGIIFGLAPALRGTRLDLTPALKEGSGSSTHAAHQGRGSSLLGNGLVVAQVALSVVMLVGAGLLIRTLGNLKSLNPGFDSHNVLLFGIDPTLAGYKGPQIDNLYRNLAEQLGAIPGVTAVSYSESALLGGGWSSTSVSYRRPDSSEKKEISTDWLPVSQTFFKTMGIPVLQGRTFRPEDFVRAPDPDEKLIAPRTPVPVIVNELFVRRYMGSTDPIGQIFGTEPKKGLGGAPSAGMQIVGVVRDAKYSNLRREINPTTYAPFTGGYGYFELRTAANPIAIAGAVRSVVNHMDSNLPLFDVRTQSEQIDLILFQERLIAQLASFFGALALGLACIGLYGLLSYEVGRRTREIGIRMALGARQLDILRQVVRQGIVLALVGAAAGIAIALGVMRYLGTFLYGVRPIDPVTFAGATVILTAVALAACYIPARRATRVDPITALRYE